MPTTRPSENEPGSQPVTSRQQAAATPPPTRGGSLRRAVTRALGAIRGDRATKDSLD